MVHRCTSVFESHYKCLEYGLVKRTSDGLVQVQCTKTVSLCLAWGYRVLALQGGAIPVLVSVSGVPWSSAVHSLDTPIWWPWPSA